MTLEITGLTIALICQAVVAAVMVAWNWYAEHKSDGHYLDFGPALTALLSLIIGGFLSVIIWIVYFMAG